MSFYRFVLHTISLVSFHLWCMFGDRSVEIEMKSILFWFSEG